ncbi:MAG: hypothetical protein AAGA72_18000 [Pseudomonadota bacterium]
MRLGFVESLLSRAMQPFWNVIELAENKRPKTIVESKDDPRQIKLSTLPEEGEGIIFRAERTTYIFAGEGAVVAETDFPSCLNVEADDSAACLTLKETYNYIDCIEDIPRANLNKIVVSVADSGPDLIRFESMIGAPVSFTTNDYEEIQIIGCERTPSHWLIDGFVQTKEQDGTALAVAGAVLTVFVLVVIIGLTVFGVSATLNWISGLKRHFV